MRIETSLPIGTIRLLLIEQNGVGLGFASTDGCVVQRRQVEALEARQTQKMKLTWLATAEVMCNDRDSEQTVLALEKASTRAWDSLQPARVHGIRGLIDANTIGAAVGGSRVAGPIDQELGMVSVERLSGGLVGILVAGAVAVESPKFAANMESMMRSRLRGGADAVILISSVSKDSISRLGMTNSSGEATAVANYQKYLQGVVGRWCELVASRSREELRTVKIGSTHTLMRSTGMKNDGLMTVSRLGTWIVTSLPFPVDMSLALFLKQQAKGFPLLVLSGGGEVSKPSVFRVGQIRRPEDRLVPAPVAEIAGVLASEVGRKTLPRGGNTPANADQYWNFDEYDLEPRASVWVADIKSPAVLGVSGRGNGRSLYLDGGALELRPLRESNTASAAFWFRLDDSEQSCQEVELIGGYGARVSIGADCRLQVQGIGIEGVVLDRQAWNHVAVTRAKRSVSVFVGGNRVTSRETSRMASLPGWRIGGLGALKVDDVAVWSTEASPFKIGEIFRASPNVVPATRAFPSDNPFPAQPGDPDVIRH